MTNTYALAGRAGVVPDCFDLNSGIRPRRRHGRFSTPRAALLTKGRRPSIIPTPGLVVGTPTSGAGFVQGGAATTCTGRSRSDRAFNTSEHPPEPARHEYSGAANFVATAGPRCARSLRLKVPGSADLHVPPRRPVPHLSRLLPCLRLQMATTSALRPMRPQRRPPPSRCACSAVRSC